MKKLTILIMAMLLALPEVPGQEQENAMEAADPQAKTAGDAGKGKESRKETPKTTQFSGQQKKIKLIMDKITKAKRMSEQRRLEEILKREQNTLKLMLNRKLQPLKDKINPLKEKIRLSQRNLKNKAEKELAAVEEEIKNLEADADLETWCKESEAKQEPANPSNPGSGKKNRKSRKRK